ncbi:hypothetical protein H6P81_003712 [Aristolochia fimbriata]|uniref:HMG-Y-related protein A n=1 Tax=Aristolochia fimbriata TaxID=158543 RepID=A0AAV7FFC1_ARIFI|nr:hypothetical protein H6P81_003712 [Aristolochia fimbriata]
MAAEEVSKPSSTTPPYPEMIFAAIDALDEKDGSSKSAISKYIESEYDDLPPGHDTLLAHHLSKMKESGELQLVKNNYMRPDPNAPPRRGRGRPPKPKPAVSPGTVISPPRPRGRPPKPRDPNAPLPPPPGPPRPRGRPPKKAKTSTASTASPRPRGRPPKAKPPFPVVGFD